MSGYRQLGSIGGDWRMIDNIASDCETTFMNIDEGNTKIDKEVSKRRKRYTG